MKVSGSTADNSSGERFRVLAMTVARTDSFGLGDFLTPARSTNRNAGQLLRSLLELNPDWPRRCSALRSGSGDPVANLRGSWNLSHCEVFPHPGIVTVADNLARAVRDVLTEEYSVSVDGVRQDFIVEQWPEGQGELRVELEVTGAKAEPLVNGARWVLDGSGSKLAQEPPASG